ncbi:allene oxide cyclase barrel-like domain-containing protein [Geodermatophilus sp. URMC 62]|uniref:allene oxide cyclase barrel-like domain-containing protein n=1 Tax=Geodermatophilus sp. URMC 62 TaxID=3423414 RepID=UPI00406C4354
MSPIRCTALATAVLLTGAGAALAVVTTATADQPLRLTLVAVPDRNTDLDLGEPGPSAGDAQVFLDDVQQDGRTVGTNAGSCTITTITETRLAGHCTATLTLPEGQLMFQGAGDEDPAVGPTGFTWAVTGGTGRWTGAGGEATGTFRTGSDTVDLEVRLH